MKSGGCDPIFNCLAVGSSTLARGTYHLRKKIIKASLVAILQYI